MALKIKTEIEIDAAAQKVWQVLTDFAHWDRWNSAIPRVQGEAKVGGKLKIVIKTAGRTMKGAPIVLVSSPNQELRWRGGLPIPGLFSGEHYFKIETLGPDQVRFIHGEDFSGLLIPILYKSPEALEQAYLRISQNLKKLLETGVGIEPQT